MKMTRVLFAAWVSAVAAEAMPLEVRADGFTEAAAIPFTVLVSPQPHPGGLVGLEWHWKTWPRAVLFQNATLRGFWHGEVQRALALTTELGVRGFVWSGLAAELSLGVGYLHSFSGSPLYAQDETGRYVPIADTGRPRVVAPVSLGLGFDLGRVGWLPLSVFVIYGGLAEFFANNTTGVSGHTLLGLSLRFRLPGGTP